MRFYRVVAKCGHVGRNHYYRGVFYIKALNGRDAAQIVRWKPRVKHHHKDAILGVCEVSWSEYKEGLSLSEKNPFFHCSNRYEQYCHYEEIYSDIIEETRDKKKRQEYYDDGGKRKKKKGLKYLHNSCKPVMDLLIKEYLNEAG